MSAGRNLLIASGRTLSKAQRPATLTTADGKTMPVTPGNLDFFEQLRADGAGFSLQRTMHVTILRADIPTRTVNGQIVPVEFKRGDNVKITDGDSGDEFHLIVGESNTKQAALLTLNLQTNGV